MLLLSIDIFKVVHFLVFLEIYFLKAAIFYLEAWINEDPGYNPKP